MNDEPAWDTTDWWRYPDCFPTLVCLVVTAEGEQKTALYEDGEFRDKETRRIIKSVVKWLGIEILPLCDEGYLL